MKRRAIQILMGLWVLFCIVTALVWAGSHVQQGPVTRQLIGRWSYMLDSRITGKVSIQLCHDFATPVVGPQVSLTGPRVQFTEAALKWYEGLPMGFSSGMMGFFVGHEKTFVIYSGNNERWTGWVIYLSVPYWFAWAMWLPVAIFLDRWLKERKRRLRVEHGLCIQCGYDLRATPQRCPECGHVKSTT